MSVSWNARTSGIRGKNELLVMRVKSEHSAPWNNTTSAAEEYFVSTHTEHVLRVYDGRICNRRVKDPWDAQSFGAGISASSAVIARCFPAASPGRATSHPPIPHTSTEPRPNLDVWKKRETRCLRYQVMDSFARLKRENGRILSVSLG